MIRGSTKNTEERNFRNILGIYFQIEDYKDKKGLDILRSYEIFCYLINLNVPDKDFDDSFSFLEKFFTRNLKAKDNNIDIFSIYFN